MKTKRIVTAVTAILFLTITALNASAQTAHRGSSMGHVAR